MDVLNWSLQIISLVTTLIGLFLIAKKRKFGFIHYIISLTCQGIIFYMRHDWVLVFQMLILISCNIYAFKEWKKGE